MKLKNWGGVEDGAPFEELMIDEVVRDERMEFGVLCHFTLLKGYFSTVS